MVVNEDVDVEEFDDDEEVLDDDDFDESDEFEEDDDEEADDVDDASSDSSEVFEVWDSSSFPIMQFGFFSVVCLLSDIPEGVWFKIHYK